MYKYLNRIFIAFSIFLNTVLGGSNNQTFSARNWQRKRDGKLHLVWLIDFVFRNKMHCCESWIKWSIIHNSIKNYNEHMGFNKKRNMWE